MRARVVEFELRGDECCTRLPFRFGGVTMRQATLAHARARVETGGGVHEGLAADLLVPRWFEKDPAKSPEDDRRDLIAAARSAGEIAVTLAADTAAGLVAAVQATVDAGTPPLAPSRLRTGFGVAMLERALLDALCRAAGLSFHAALRANLFGLDLAAADPALRGLTPAAVVAANPRRHIEVRHTVGMHDPLRGAEIDPAARLRDGLPQALDEDIRAYGLRLFKVKVGAGRGPDLDRLRAVAAVAAAEASPDWRFSIDANEQYSDLDELIRLLEGVAADRLLGPRLLYVEQPLPRQQTFARASAPALARAAALAPLLIDEADVDAGAFPAAVALGYRGVSVKNCKGVLRAVVNAARCVRLRAQGTPAFQSAEDLTNLPVVALQQDLATVQALGLPHAERNGHHYFAGLLHLPPHEAAEAAAAHPDLYRLHGTGYALRIEAGLLAVGSLLCPGYGYATTIDFAARTPLDGGPLPARPL